ncbi:MAG: hypothetical protein LBL66_02160 [Clostridiales bacterium]|nr:hypothetical protein [Clostridiales bacterium]
MNIGRGLAALGALVLLAFCAPAPGLVRADTVSKSVQFISDAPGFGFKSYSYGDLLEYGPDGAGRGVSYVWNGEGVSFALNDGVDISGFDLAKAALDFWVYTTKPQSVFTGDNQIEVSNNIENHDSNEYQWHGSDVFWSTEYETGKWNHVQLKFGGKAGVVNLNALSWFRFYYIGAVAGSEPVLITGVKIVETDRWTANPSAGWIVETRDDNTGVIFGDVALPANCAEGQKVTLPVCPATDPVTGAPIARSKITVSVVGPSGLISTGTTLFLNDGGGEYAVTYTAMNCLGNTYSKTVSLSVAQSATDAASPRLLQAENFPADFKVGGEYELSDWLTIADNRGAAQADAAARITDAAGIVKGEYNGKADVFALVFRPESKQTYRLQIHASDAAGNVLDVGIELKTYTDADPARSVRMFDFTKNDAVFTGAHKNRLVDARPSQGFGKSIEFNYKGGAGDTSDNDAYYQEARLLNNNAPDFFSSVDLRWACLKFWIFIDRAYPNDGQWMPADGGGFGNLGLGLTAQNGIYNIPIMAYTLNELKLAAGWTEVSFKLGRVFQGNFNYGNICQFYIYSNWGGARRILINDIRIEESAEFPEGLMPADATGKRFAVGRKEAVGAYAAVDVDNTAEVRLKENYYMYTPVRLPGIQVADYAGEVDRIAEPDVWITDPEGVTTRSLYFTPMCEGVHTILYRADNYYGQAVETSKTFTVHGPHAAPEITLGNTEELRFKRGAAIALPPIDGWASDGGAVSLTVAVYKPDGLILQAGADGKYISDRTGVHTVKILAVDAVEQETRVEFTFTVYDEFTSAYYDAPAGLTPLAVGLIAGGGALILAGGATVAAVLIARKRRKTA